MATKDEIRVAKTLSQLQALERRDNYSYGWALKVWKAKNDRSKRSGKSSSAVVQKAQNQNAQDEWGGEQRVARPSYLYSQYAAVD